MALSNSHPFILWVTAQRACRNLEAEGKDIILGDGAARRFALGVHDKEPLLCWSENDQEAMESINWTSAAIAYDLKKRDWIALSAADIRIKNSSSLNPVPLRMFIPITAGRMDPWAKVAPKSLHLGIIAKAGTALEGTASRAVPLKLIGVKQVPDKIAAERIGE